MLQKQSWPWHALAPSQKQRLTDLVARAELAFEISEEFKAAEIPSAFSTYAAKAMHYEQSIPTDAIDKALDELDPRTSLKMSLKNFQQADEDKTGVLNLDGYARFWKLEIQGFFEHTGFSMPFSEELLEEGFLCTQFEGKDGITFTDIQVAQYLMAQLCLKRLGQESASETSVPLSCPQVVQFKDTDGDLIELKLEGGQVNEYLNGELALSGIAYFNIDEYARTYADPGGKGRFTETEDLGELICLRDALFHNMSLQRRQQALAACNAELLKVMSAEGDIFTVELEVAYLSTLLMDLAGEGGCDEEIPLPNVKTAVLSKVLDYCQHHKHNLCPAPIQKPLRNKNLIDCGVSKWDCEYINVENDMIFQLILAANYLDIKGLLDLSCAKIASKIKGRTPEEIREEFALGIFEESDQGTPLEDQPGTPGWRVSTASASASACDAREERTNRKAPEPLSSGIGGGLGDLCATPE
jgi:S-phase kinase-associated protein 1